MTENKTVAEGGIPEAEPEIVKHSIPLLITHANRDTKKGIQCTRFDLDGVIIDTCVLMPGADLDIKIEGEGVTLRIEIIDNP